jgi:hypothetical protein
MSGGICRSKTESELCTLAGNNWVGGERTTLTIANPANPKIGGIGVQTKSNAIMLANIPHNAKVEVYNLKGERAFQSHPASGTPLQRGTSNSENSQILKIQVQTKGVYIVKISYGSEKQILRVPVR